MATEEELGSKGEFRLLSKIGEGGMADVFLAERMGDDGFRTRVALKRLHQGLSMDSYFIRQLVREARLLGQLEHANIVRVFDLRRIGDEYYVVMEYVDGIDLAAVIRVHRQRKTRVPLPFFFHVAFSLLEALSYAHTAVDSEGRSMPLIHRDIKPSNVMLSRRGVVKLTDFGIAHVGEGSVTGGLVQGTANYMSPEQAYGEEHLSAASDLYSLGVVFFEMLTGRPLVSGDNYLKAIQQVREQEVSAESLERLGVKPGLRMVVARMLANDREQRYADPDMVRNDLQFVADRLAVNLSWHKIRAYVGRLMNILGREPSRVTLSNLEVDEESSLGGFGSGSFAAEISLPAGGDASAESSLEGSALQTGSASLADVTAAVAKDLVDSKLQPGKLSEEETQPVAPAYEEDEDEERTVALAIDAAAEPDDSGEPLTSSAVVSNPGVAADWIEGDETAVYTGELPGAVVAEANADAMRGEQLAVSGAGVFGDSTDERTVPYVAGGLVPAPGQPDVEPVAVSDASEAALVAADVAPPGARMSGAFPPPPPSLTGEFRPLKQPPKTSPSVAFLPEATEAGPTGTQVLGGDEDPGDKTWVLGSGDASGPPAASGPAAPPPAAASPGVDPARLEARGRRATGAQQAGAGRRRPRKRRRKKSGRAKGFMGLDKRTVLLAAIFSVVIGTLLFVILIVLLMRSPQAQQQVPTAEPLVHLAERLMDAGGWVEPSPGSGILDVEATGFMSASLSDLRGPAICCWESYTT